MIKKVNNGFKLMIVLDTFLILLGIGAYYHMAFLALPALGIINMLIMIKRRRDFIEDYNAYNCAEEENTIIPDKFVKSLYYGKKHLYFTNIVACSIMPYDGLEIEKVTSTLVHLANKNCYGVNKNKYKKKKLDISQVNMDNFESYFLHNIEEAKNIDIDNTDFQNIVDEREMKQKSISPTKIFILLLCSTFGVLIPTMITFKFNESVAVGVLLGTLIIVTIISVPVTINYFKQLFRYKRELEEENGSIPQFYRTYVKFAFLPIVMLLGLWFISIVMAADIWFNTWLF